MEYDERLSPPIRWWLIGLILVASLWLAVAVAAPAAVAAVVALVSLIVLAVLLTSVGSARVRVRDGWLVAGRARIQAGHLGPVTALSGEETRRVAGRDADARAYLLLRPYLKESVRVEITDPADPAPYWLVSTRRSAQLAQAISALTADV